MKVGFTGTQRGMTTEQYLAVWELLEDATEVHHGDCIGADAEFHKMARERKRKIIVHPPLNSSRRAWCIGHAVTIRKSQQYLKRNHDIVKESTMLIACPATVAETLRSGTWATVRYARKQNKYVVIINPDGTMYSPLNLSV